MESVVSTGRRVRYLTCRLAVLLLVLSSFFPASVGAEEDILRLLIWDGYAPEKYVEDFEKQIEAKYGRKLKMEITVVGGPEDFYGPIRNKKVDVVTISHHYFKDERFNFIARGMLLPIETENLSNFRDVIPTLRQADYLSSGGNTYGVPICQGPYGLGYNAGKFEQAPDSWRIFWDAKYKGEYVLGGNEYLYNIGMAALAWGYPRDLISSYDALNNEDFKEKLRRLTTGAASFWIGQDSPDDLMGKSLAAVWGDSFGVLRKRGEPWKVAEPKEGTLFWVDNYAMTWALTDKPFLRKVAEEWMDRLLEPDYQVDYIVREISLGPITTNVDALLTDGEKERLHVDVPELVENDRILLPALSRRDRNGLKLLWEQAMEGIRIEKGAD